MFSNRSSISRGSALAIAALAAVACLGMADLASASVIDNFATNDSSNYNYFVAYNPNNNNPTPDTFAVSTYNGNPDFLPNMRLNEADIWLYNGGQTLNVGGTLSVEFLAGTSNQNGQVGLVISPQINSTNNGATFGVQDISGTYTLLVGANSLTLSGTQTGLSTMTVTEPTADTYDVTVSGGGLTTGSLSVTTTYSTANFGLWQFSNALAAGQPEENLTLVTPEPATLVLVAVGGLGLLLLKRRKTV